MPTGTFKPMDRIMAVDGTLGGRKLELELDKWVYPTHGISLWIQVGLQVPPKKILQPLNCTLSAFREATWIHRVYCVF